MELEFARLAPVVEARLYLRTEAHRAAHHAHQPHQPVTAGRTTLGDRHEVDHLANPVGAQKRVIKIAVSGKYSCRLA